ncbi:TRAP transporter large permease [Aquibium sp. LZ166]|uniref:TRAP transporter large permease protein n=1 Tax=Aquibium pacificus TaxID=3153579 RepID=A0ABV3SRU4_9HYPH
MILAVLFLGTLLLLFTGVPIFAGLALSAIVASYIAHGSLMGLADIFVGEIDSYLLVAIPLFAFMANIIIRTRVVDDLFRFADTLTRHLPGGLGVATILSCTVFAAISGSSVATALTIGAVAVPQMQKYGYATARASGAVAGGGTLGILIPPSGPMILYAAVSNASVGALFIAGILPGLLLAVAFAVYVSVSSRFSTQEQTRPRAGLPEIVATARSAIAPLLLPVAVLGGIYSGYFTVSEAAAVGVIGALLIALFVYRTLTWRALYEAAHGAAMTATMILAIVAASGLFSHVLTISRLPMQVLEAVAHLELSALPFILLVMVFIFVLGMFLEAVAIILITTPIVLPVLLALDVDLIWYGILLVVNLELAMLTPPVGLNLFVLKATTRAPLSTIIRGAFPYIVVLVMFLALMFVVPDLATWLPRRAGYG